MTSLEVPSVEDISFSPSSSNSTDTNSSALQAPERKVIGFRRNEPGFKITAIINLFLLVNGFIFVALALIDHSREANEPVKISEYENYDIIGTGIFCFWNSIVWTLILYFPSLTTTKREKFLWFYYLNGFSVLLFNLSDFFNPMTRYEMLSSAMTKIFYYLFFTALFCVSYAMPEEFHELSRMNSLKPWLPIYENDPQFTDPIRPTDRNNITNIDV